MLSIDFETRSTIDLKRTGAYVYAEHPSTEVLCMAYALDDGEVQLWLPGDPIPGELDVPGEWRAWNAAFERLIWDNIMVQRHGFPAQPLERWVDTAAEAAAMALPRSLEQAARVLNVPEQKDDAGHRIMLQLSKPRRPRKGEDPDGVYWWEDEGKLRRLYEYCMQDVRTERAIARRLHRLSEYERGVYLLDQRINDRGVLLDQDLVDAAGALAIEATERANIRLAELTNGEVEAVTNVQNLQAWLSKQGVELEDLRKQTVADLLMQEHEPIVTEVLALRAETAKTSLAKLTAMQRAACVDGRVRGMLLYHGASTGRWAGRLVQPQNFPRGTVENVEQYIPQVLCRHYLDSDEGSMPEILSSLLRSCFIAAPAHTFMCADFSAIEARVLAWLADQTDLVLLFENNEPIYEIMAAEIFNVPFEDVTASQRHVGKTAVLGAGYQMGWKKYQQTVKDWTGEEITEDLARLAINTYRERNYKVAELWYALNNAVLAAVNRPGLVVEPRPGLKYVVRSDYLWCVLPSSRPLAYALPSIVDRETPWGDMQMAVEVSLVDSLTNKWVRRPLYGGWLTENVVQALARDLMTDAMIRVERAGYPVVLTVHDEILAEVPGFHGSLDDFCQIMQQTPAWAAGLPVAVDGWIGLRYRK